MKKRVLLAKYENLLSAAKGLEDDPDMGADMNERIAKIRSEVEKAEKNINRLRKKVKPAGPQRPERVIGK